MRGVEPRRRTATLGKGVEVHFPFLVGAYRPLGEGNLTPAPGGGHRIFLSYIIGIILRAFLIASIRKVASITRVTPSKRHGPIQDLRGGPKSINRGRKQDLGPRAQNSACPETQGVSSRASEDEFEAVCRHLASGPGHLLDRPSFRKPE